MIKNHLLIHRPMKKTTSFMHNGKQQTLQLIQRVKNRQFVQKIAYSNKETTIQNIFITKQFKLKNFFDEINTGAHNRKNIIHDYRSSI
jgi:hypothetical protein